MINCTTLRRVATSQLKPFIIIDLYTSCAHKPPSRMGICVQSGSNINVVRRFGLMTCALRLGLLSLQCAGAESDVDHITEKEKEM
eukprot:3092756-Karenia_brevis.AAC.1